MKVVKELVARQAAVRCRSLIRDREPKLRPVGISVGKNQGFDLQSEDHGTNLVYFVQSVSRTGEIPGFLDGGQSLG